MTARRGHILWAIVACVAVGGAGPSACAAPTEFYVAPNGSDANPGTQEKPFASAEAARDALRRLKKEGGLPGPVTVWVRGGMYRRQARFELKEQDSGTAEAPIEYRAFPKEEVRWVGGLEIPASACERVQDSQVLDRLETKVRSRMLAVNLRARGITNYGEMSLAGPMLEVFCRGRRLPVARWPNSGWLHVGKVVATRTNGTLHLVDGNSQGRTFRYEGDRPERWRRSPAAVLHGFWWFGWMDDQVGLEQVDPERKEITLARVPAGGIKERQWFYALNLLEELDQPGEWFLDRVAGILYFLPPEDFPAYPLTVSTLSEPLLVWDQCAYVTVRGLVLEVTRSVAVVMGGGTHNRLAGCIVRGVGSDAVVMDHGTQNAVLGCDLHDVGGTVIRLSGGNRSTLTPSENSVVNNHIHHYAQRKKVYHPAVRLFGVGHRVAHNLIHDAPHQAIAYDGNDHRIEFNEIYQVVLESSDAGVLYTGCDWTFRGNRVQHNFIHHIPHGPDLGTVGIYLDDCASSTDILGNVFYQVRNPTFIGGGRDNRVENNLFIECDTPLYLDSRGLRWDHFRPGGPMYENLRRVPYQKPPWSTRYPELALILDEIPQAPLGNTFVNNVSFRSRWRDPEAYCRATSTNNIDRPYLRMAHNWVTDQEPGFVDPAQMNFQLRDDAVVFRKVPGFQKIPFERIGLYADEYRATWPVARVSQAPLGGNAPTNHSLVR